MTVSPVTRRRFLALSGAAAAHAALGVRRAAAAPADAPEAMTTRFAADLYGQLRTGPGSLFLSPFSISAALAMTSAGARGGTLAEMRKVLHLSDDPHPGFGRLIARINGAGAEKRAYQLSTANALWGQAGYPWRPEFAALLQKHYGAGFVETDFKADPEAARAQINKWVEKETRERIKDLIGPGILTPLTRLVLTNAIYFKADWLTKFKKEATTDQPFHRADGTTAPVPLMSQQARFPYAEADGAQVLELPYLRNELSMVVVLPGKPDGLPALEAALSADKLAGWRAAARPTITRVFLPRFKVESSLALNAPLKALGMGTAFDAGRADFTGMHASPERLAITAVLHKAFVDVTEAGTEAAAATAVVVGRASAPIAEDPKVFRADRPFLFLIRENETGAVLFLGRYAGPGK